MLDSAWDNHRTSNQKATHACTYTRSPQWRERKVQERKERKSKTGVCNTGWCFQFHFPPPPPFFSVLLLSLSTFSTHQKVVSFIRAVTQKFKFHVHNRQDEASPHWLARHLFREAVCGPSAYSSGPCSHFFGTRVGPEFVIDENDTDKKKNFKKINLKGEENRFLQADLTWLLMTAKPRRPSFLSLFSSPTNKKKNKKNK